MRYAVAVAEERSFTRAARRCFVAQSSLSHQIKALERELGVTLFARTSRRVDLTPAGEAFVAAARASLYAAERAVDDAAAATGQISGALSIGVIPTVTAIDLPAVLASFHRSFPAVRITLHSGGSDEFLAAIKEGSMDVAVLGLSDTVTPRGVHTHVLAREHLVAVLPGEHPLAARSTLQLADLADQMFVDFPRGTSGRAPSDIAFERAGVQRDVAFEATSTGLILDLVRHNLATALLPAALVPDDRQLAAIPLTNGPARIEYLAWSSYNPSAAAEAFAVAIRS